MKHLLVAAAVLAAPLPGRAQERVPEDEAKRIAKHLGEVVKEVKLPLKGETDFDRPFAMRKDEFGALVVPDRGLAAATFDKLDKAVTPAGQLWLRNLLPVVDGKPLPADRLQAVKVMTPDREVEVFVCQLGLRKDDKGKPELVVLSKGTEPLARLPLEAATEKQELPLEFDAVREGDDRAVLKIGLVGKHQGKLVVAPVK